MVLVVGDWVFHKALGERNLCLGLLGWVYEEHRMLTTIRRRDVGKRFGSSFRGFIVARYILNTSDNCLETLISWSWWEICIIIACHGLPIWYYWLGRLQGIRLQFPQGFKIISLRRIIEGTDGGTTVFWREPWPEAPPWILCLPCAGAHSELGENCCSWWPSTPEHHFFIKVKEIEVIDALNELRMEEYQDIKVLRWPSG